MFTTSLTTSQKALYLCLRIRYTCQTNFHSGRKWINDGVTEQVTFFEHKGFMDIWNPSVRKLWQVFGNPFNTLHLEWMGKKFTDEIRSYVASGKSFVNRFPTFKVMAKLPNKSRFWTWKVFWIFETLLFENCEMCSGTLSLPLVRLKNNWQKICRLIWQWIFA